MVSCWSGGFVKNSRVPLENGSCTKRLSIHAHNIYSPLSFAIRFDPNTSVSSKFVSYDNSFPPQVSFLYFIVFDI